jgi:hypothetical protein
MTMDPITTLAEIRQLYFKAAPATFQRDFVRAMDLLKALPNEAESEKANRLYGGRRCGEWGAPAALTPGFVCHQVVDVRFATDRHPTLAASVVISQLGPAS